MDEEIEDFLAKYEGNFHILEEQIDITTQMSYFKFSKRLKGHAEEDALARAIELNDEEVDFEDKKRLLVSIASLQEVKAFRTLESFFKGLKFNDPARDWAYLALTESRMAMESSLSDEKQIFISTGLGGKPGMLRYFIVLFPHNEEEGFNDFQIDFIKKEFQFTLQTNDCESEFRESRNEFISFLALIPLEVQLKELVLKVFESANQLSDFVSEKFIITNVKIMEEQEIFDFYKNGDESEDFEEIELE